MAVKTLRNDGFSESKFMLKDLETEVERKQLSAIFGEANMGKIESERCGKKCIELIAVDKETGKVIGGSVSIIQNHEQADILTAVELGKRRKGVGSALLKANEDKLRKEGVKKANILPPNAGAHDFLVKNGYKYAGDVEQKAKGEFVPSYMEKLL